MYEPWRKRFKEKEIKQCSDGKLLWDCETRDLS